MKICYAVSVYLEHVSVPYNCYHFVSFIKIVI